MCLPIFSQTIEETKVIANSALISIVGRPFFETAFRYNCTKSATRIAYTRWPDCNKKTVKQKRLFAKENQQSKSKSFEIVYDCLLLDTIEGLVEIHLDEKGNVKRFIGIKPSDSSSLLSTLSITKIEAIAIAVKSGFKLGFSPWEVSLTYQKPTSNQGDEKYYWEIKNTLVPVDKTQWNSEGEIFRVDASNGVVSGKITWVKQMEY